MTSSSGLGRGATATSNPVKSLYHLPCSTGRAGGGVIIIGTSSQVQVLIVSRPSRPKQGRGGGVPELRNIVSNLLKVSGYYTYAHPLVLHTTDGTRRGRTSVCSGTAPLTTIPPRPSSPRGTDKTTTCCSSNGNIWLALPCAPPPTLSLSPRRGLPSVCPHASSSESSSSSSSSSLTRLSH